MQSSNSKISSWETYNEDLYSSDDSSTFSAVGLLEQINVTRDASDYLWYTTRWAKIWLIESHLCKIHGVVYVFNLLFLQLWCWLVGVFSSRQRAPNSYSSISWSHSPCFCEWRAFWYTVYANIFNYLETTIVSRVFVNMQLISVATLIVFFRFCFWDKGEEEIYFPREYQPSCWIKQD